MAQLTPEDQKKQELYRDARSTNKYDQIWQSVGKCVFCDLKEKYVIYEENGVVLTISLYAYIDGHCMVIPRRHIKSSKELTASEWETVRKLKYIAKKLIKDTHGIKGMQFVQKDGALAQSTVEDHLHFHCIPFDTPDLLEWNYRKLEYTPLENADAYRHARKKIITAGAKFDSKYDQPSTLGVCCDAVIINTDKEILFQERAEDQKLSPDYITLPGGIVDSFNGSLEAELIREVAEETGIDLNKSKLELVSSRIDGIKRIMKSTQLKATYPMQDTFIRNTYLINDFDKNTKLSPGDDAKSLVWIPINNIASHPRISESTKEIMGSIQL
jgi:histidine triad (HIT) family protein